MTAVARPAGRPKMTRDEVLALVQRRHIDFRPEAALAEAGLMVVGIRGYYRDGLGAPGRNDRGIYDDALFLILPSGGMLAVNANTDPSRVRKGSGTGAGKGMARLNPGVWPVYRFDVHRRGTASGHEALCQRAGPVSVTRDGVDGEYQDRGDFGINIHRGGVTTTSSEGCQTIPPDQWGGFIDAAMAAARKASPAAWRKKAVTYVLLEGV